MTNSQAPGQHACRSSRWRRAKAVRLALAFGLGGASVATTLLASSEASAQEWMKDRRYQEGAGIKAGNLELHPGVGGEAGYDSNWFMRTHEPGFVNSNVKGAGVFRLTPSLSLSTLGPQRVEQPGVGLSPSPIAFRAGVSATFRQFIGDQEVRDQGTIPSGNVSINAAAKLDFNQGRPVGFGLNASYQRVIQPNNGVSDPNLSFNRSILNGGGEVVFMPGGGTLDLRGGYQIYANLFEETNGAPFTNLQHEFSVRNRWRFRPRTALFHDTNLRVLNYVNSERSVNLLNDGTPVRTRFGLTGLVSDRFGVLLAAGYGATFFSNPNAPSSTQFDSVIGQAEGTIYLSQGAGANEPGQATLLLSTLSLGYLRDFQTSLLGNYFTADRLYTRIAYAFGGKAILQLDGFGELDSYPQPFLNTGGGIVPVNIPGTATPVGDFQNWRVGGTFFGEYRLTDSFGINATLDYIQTISDTAVQTDASVAAPGTINGFHLAWRRFQALGGVRWFL